MNFLKKLFGSSSEKEQPQEQQAPQSQPQTPPLPQPTTSGDPLEKYKSIPWMTEMRLDNISTCLAAGFKPASSLPTDLGRQLRPTIEIAKRLSALKAVVLWVMVLEENLPTEVIHHFIVKNDLEPFLTNDEIDILNASRTDQNSRNAIGWKFENVWPLAWYFGYDVPEITGTMMTGEQMQDILINHTCPLELNLEAWVQSKKTVSEEDLMKKEDLFYCLHNAARSALMGNPSVPPDFNPRREGGVVHERRHALTWMLSAGVAWEETDLST